MAVAEVEEVAVAEAEAEAEVEVEAEVEAEVEVAEAAKPDRTSRWGPALRAARCLRCCTREARPRRWPPQSSGIRFRCPSMLPSCFAPGRPMGRPAIRPFRSPAAAEVPFQLNATMPEHRLPCRALRDEPETGCRPESQCLRAGRGATRDIGGMGFRDGLRSKSAAATPSVHRYGRCRRDPRPERSRRRWVVRRRRRCSSGAIREARGSRRADR